MSAPISSLPMIPGMMSSQRHFIGRPHFRRGQLLEQMTMGKDITSKAMGGMENALNHDQIRPSSPVSNEKSEPLPKDQTIPSATSTATRHPRWVKYDRQVLRFYGYFEEAAEERGEAAMRVRRVVLYYYLTDNSISISEPRVPNSGIAQGEFMKRTRVSKPNHVGVYSPDDFAVGGNVTMYGRVIHLVDCDDATRAYYHTSTGSSQASPRKYPDDRGSQLDEVDVLKQRLRAQATSALESKAEAVRKFHQNTQKVLRFYVSWMDPHPLYPEKRHYVLHYYLSDDTIEIIEPKPERDGRGHFAVLLSRRKMTNDDKMYSITPGQRPNKYIVDRDLRCGDYVHVCARRFLLEDCDPFTREYYLVTHGVTQEPYEPQQQPAQQVHQQRGAQMKWKLFQASQVHNPEKLQPARCDMLARLAMHVAHDTPTKNNHFFRKDELEGKQLRFRARFHGLSSRDTNAHRSFVLTYYLEDDTLSVFEPAIKNSGIIGGRFLERGRFRKCTENAVGGTATREREKQSSPYCASDFYVGAIVGFEFSPNQRLEITDADLQTLTYCEIHGREMFPFSDAEAILDIIVARLVESRQDCRLECHQWTDTDRSAPRQYPRTLTIPTLRSVLTRLNILDTLNAQQFITLCRRFEKQKDPGGPNEGEAEKQFLCDDFCDAVSFRAHSATCSQDEYSDIRRCEELRRLLRELDELEGGGGTVSIDDFVNVTTSYHVSLSANNISTITAVFGSGGRLDYNSLCDRAFTLPFSSSNTAGYSRAPKSGIDTPRQVSNNDSDDLALLGDSMFDDETNGDEAIAPTSFAETTDRASRVPRLPTANSAKDSTTAARISLVVALLQRVFGSRKYHLRKALRDRDTDKSGQLGEDAFMDAVMAVEPRLSDDDAYLIADVYFPSNNCRVDYSLLLERAFRTL